MNTRNSGLEGFYTLKKFKVDRDGNPISGTESEITFKNVITNQGLNEIGTRTIDSAIRFVHVGSGNTPAQASDTGLTNFIASSSSQQINTRGVQDAVEPYYSFTRRTVRFAAGSAAGNLSEVGVGWEGAGSNLFSRALIQDALGNPTTITVLADEALDVTYEIRIFPPTEDFVTTAVDGGITYDVIVRPAELGNSFFWSTSSTAGSGSPTQSGAYDGSIADIFGRPNGVRSSFVQTADPYQNNSLSGSYAILIGLNQANSPSGVRSLLISAGITGWQVEFINQSDGSPIPKDETRELRFSFSYSWSRRDTQ